MTAQQVKDELGLTARLVEVHGDEDCITLTFICNGTDTKKLIIDAGPCATGECRPGLEIGMK